MAELWIAEAVKGSCNTLLRNGWLGVAWSSVFIAKVANDVVDFTVFSVSTDSSHR